MESYLKFIEELSFIRCAGTAEEKRAGDIIGREIVSAGGTYEEMPFMIDTPVIEKAGMRVGDEEIPCLPYGMSGNLPEGGVTLRLRYLERGDEMDYLGLGDLSDTAVLLNTLTLDAYKLLAAHKAAAFIVMGGAYYQDMESASLYGKNLRPTFYAHGKIPGFLITAADATRLVQEEVQQVHLTLRQREEQSESRDLLAVIPGESEESIVLTAHYDSVPVGTGAWDNASGAAALLGIYRSFLGTKPKRTLRFIWCGSEELGLLGSKAYIAQNETLLPKIKFCFNFDMCGTALGPNRIFVTGGKELEQYVRQFTRELGYSAQILVKVHSSDSAPFADKGIPALGLSRRTETANIHTNWDRIALLNEKAMVRNVDFAVKLIDRVTNAVVLPVDTGMPQDMLDALDKYFLREKKKK